MAQLLTESNKKVVVNVAIAFVFVLSGLNVSGIRVDKFGKTDFENRMVAERQASKDHTDKEIAESTVAIYAYISEREKAHHIVIPPEPSRMRIRAIEHCLEVKCWTKSNGFKPPTLLWYKPLE